MRQAQVEEFHVITWEAKKEQIFEMPTGGAAIMRQGPNLLKLARKEQCLALLTQLRTKFKTDGAIYRVFPNGEVQYLHPKVGSWPFRFIRNHAGEHFQPLINFEKQSSNIPNLLLMRAGWILPREGSSIQVRLNSNIINRTKSCFLRFLKLLSPPLTFFIFCYLLTFADSNPTPTCAASDRMSNPLPSSSLVREPWTFKCLSKYALLKFC